MEKEKIILRGFKKNPLVSSTYLGEFPIDSITNGDIEAFGIYNGNGKEEKYPITLDLLKSIDNCIDIAKHYSPNLICGNLMDRKDGYSYGNNSLQLMLLKWEGKKLVQKIDLKKGEYVSEEVPVLYIGVGAVIDMDDNFGRYSKVYVFPNGIIYEEKGRDSVLQKDPAELE